MPAPVIIATRRDGWSSYHCQRALSCQCSDLGIEFIFWGRLRVRRRIWGVGKVRRQSVQGGGGGVDILVVMVLFEVEGRGGLLGMRCVAGRGFVVMLR